MTKSNIRSILSLLIFSIYGFTAPVQEPNSAPPAWVSEPPANTPDKMWGVGEGDDLESAKRSALKDVAARLRVAISANIETSVTVRQDTVDRYSRTSLSEDVQRTEFRNFRLEKSVAFVEGFYALVSVDRRAFIADAEQQLVAAEKEISDRLAGSESSSIERFVAQQKALPWMEKAAASAQLLSAADPGFDVDRLANHQAALSKARSAAGDLIFDIKAGKDSQDVANTLRTFLNESGMRVGGGGAALVVGTSIAQDTIYGSHTVQLRINLSVLDARQRNLASREFTVHGSSVTNYQLARQVALKILGEKLREAGPLAALGFNQ
ncbi:MAG TPA: LPP20 family lipoprotein [Gallionella sp.]